jgi:Zn-dependent peptidase ImmA (M78 family)
VAATRLDNIRPEMLKWAFQRAGFSEEDAVSVFPPLGEWLSLNKFPTVKQLQKFADKFHTPFGYLFLNQPPKENMPIPVFRGKGMLHNHFDLNVYDTIINIQGRQDWLESYLIDNDIETCKFVGNVNLNTPVNETVNILRNELDLEPRWAFGLANVESAVSMLTQRLEQSGVFLAYNGVVGNNTHRSLKVSECRGFALVNKVAPYIFVNSGDSKNAQMFTLIHETAHLMLGISAGHAGEEIIGYNINDTETYCDKVAAEFLVPASELRDLWNGNIKYISRRFKVSEIVVARRAHDVGLLSDKDYQDFWTEYCQRPIMVKKEHEGGSFYLTSVKRVGRIFAIHVRNAVNNRQLSYTEAYRLTGLYGKTYQNFMTNNI